MGLNWLKRLFVLLLTISGSLFGVTGISLEKAPNGQENSQSSYKKGNALDADSLFRALNSQVEDGISFSSLNFKYIVPVKTISKEYENGEIKKDENGKAISIYKDQTIEINDGTLKVRKDEDTLYFSASLPIKYNEQSLVTFNANYVDNVLYVDIVDTDTSLDNYAFKYKIGIAKGSSSDELSELIDYLYDLVDKYGSILDLGFVSNVDASSILGITSELTHKTSLSIAETVEKDNGSYDYEISLQIGDISLPFTINCQSDGTLLGFSIFDSYGNPIEISNSDRTSKIYLSSKSSSCSGYTGVKPSDADKYESLINIEKLLGRLYPLINEPSFVGNGSFSLEHIVSKNDDGTAKKKETAFLSMDLKADVSNVLNNKNLNFTSVTSLPNAISTSFGFDINTNDDNGNSKTTHRDLSLDLSKEKDENGNYLDLGYAYLTTDALATKMDFFTLDAMIGKIVDMIDFDSKSSLRGSLSEGVVNDIKGVTNKIGIGETINSLLDAYLAVTGEESALKSLETGEYEKLLSLISFFGNSSHEVENIDGSIATIKTIDIVLDLSKIALEGTVSVSLYDGTAKNLAGFSLKGVKFGDISISGDLYFREAKDLAVEPASTTLERTYLRRVPDLFDGLSSFASSKSASFSLYGSMLSTDASDGFEIEKGNGNISFDLTNKNGTGSIIFKDHKSSGTTQNYRLGIDIKEIYENGQMLSDQSDMYFMVNTPESGAAPLVGYFSIDSLNGILSLLKAFSKTEDEQFTKYLTWIQSAETSSLISKVINGNQINPLLASGVIKSLSNNELSKEVNIVINGEVLALDNDLTLKINYEGDYFTLDGKSENVNRTKGKITSVNVKVVTGGKNIDMTVDFEDYLAPGATLGDSYNWNAYSYGSLFSGGANGIHNKDNYTDWSSIQFLLQYVLNSSLLGRGETYQFASDGVTASMSKIANANSFSTYHLNCEIKVSASVIRIKVTTITLKLNLYVYLKGSTVKVYGSLETPKVVIVNGSKFVSYFAYETDASNPKGTMYIERYKGGSSNGLHKVSGSDFTSNIADWIVGFMMGLFEGSAIDYDTFHSSSSSSNSDPIYVEKVFTGKSFNYSKDENGNPSWNDIALDIGALGLSELSGNVSASIKGNAKANSLSSLTLSGSIKYSVITANIEEGNFVLDNVNGNGEYSDAWGEASSISSYSSIGNGATGFQYVKNRVESGGERSRLPGGSFAGTFSGTNSSNNNIVLTVNYDGSASIKKNGNAYFGYSGDVTIKAENWEEKTLTVYVKGKEKWYSIKTKEVTYYLVKQADGTYKDKNNTDGLRLQYQMK